MKNEIGDEVTRLLVFLAAENPDSESYKIILDNLTTLVDIKAKQKPWYLATVTNPAVIGGIFQIMATLIVIKHEEVGIITSRAFQWIRFR